MGGIGVYCEGYTQAKSCPDRQTTEDLGSDTIDKCKCGPGFFKQDGECTMCPLKRATPNSGLFFKSGVGDNPCNESCPDGSKELVDSGRGPRGPESCLCRDDRVKVLDLETGAFTCEPRESIGSQGVRTVADVAAVNLSFH